MRGRPASMSSSFFFLLLHCYLLFLLSLTPWCSSCAQHMLLPNSSLPADLLAGGGGNKVVTDGLRRYLARFGYINMSQPADEDGDAGLLRLYQQTMGIPPTGRLDNLTAGLLSTPRCGVPDLPNVTSRFAYFDGHPRWTTSSRGAGAPHRRFTQLTYAIIVPTTNTGSPRPSAVRAAFRRAFARWARVIPVRFVELNTGSGEFSCNTADVKVGFFAGDHGDGEPFDGPLGVLAHAFSPPSGQLHLDAAERWTVHLDDSSAVDLESVATHEIGHVLGLAHSSAPDAVMYPSLKPGTRKVDLTADDVRGVQALYGSNPRFSLSSLSEPADTSSSESEASAQASPPAVLLLTVMLALISSRCMLYID